MLPKPDRNPSPIGNGRGIDEWNAPGPVIRGKKVIQDDLEEPVSTFNKKLEKAQIIKDRLTILEAQLFDGSNTGIGRKSAIDELKHSSADSGTGKFRLAYDKRDNAIVPGYETIGKRTPKEKMIIASAQSPMSTTDKQIYERAKKELELQKRKAIITATLVGTPLCGGLIYLATQIIK